MGEVLLADLRTRHGFGLIFVDLTKNMEVYNQPKLDEVEWTTESKYNMILNPLRFGP